MKGRILFLLLLAILLTSLHPKNIYLVLVYGVIVNALLFKKKWDNTAIVLLFFSAFYSLIQYLDGRILSWAYFVSYIFCPLAFYRLGIYYTEKVQTKIEFITLWGIIILCYSLPLAMETFNSINSIGIVNPFRTMGSEGDEAMNATLYGMHASLGLSGISLFFSNLKKIKIQKILFIIAFFISLLTIIHLVNRTGLVIIVLSLIVYLKYSSKMTKRLVLLFFFVVVLVYLLVYTNVIPGEIVEAYVNRENKGVDQSSYTAGGRSDLWLNAIEHLFTSPFGFPTERYAHNLWLDIARVSGIFALVPFMVATIQNYRCLFSILKRGEMGITPLLLGLNVVMFLTACVEPMIGGSALYFYLFMFLWGCNNEICREKIK